MANHDAVSTTPRWFRPVAIVALIWNLLGCFAYLSDVTMKPEDIAKLTIAGLWIFSDNDPSIPVDLSIDRLKGLRKGGRPFDYVLFSGLGHNNMDETFSVATDWIGRQKR